MTKYELAVVLSAKPEDETRAATLEKVKELVTNFGGEITKVMETGKRRLAYEIQKQTEGYYYFIKFEAEPSCPAEVESRIRITDGVLRYLIVKDELGDAAVDIAPKAEEAAAAPAAPAEAPAAQAPEAAPSEE
ncbi:MAG: 30S ribosomal protein S6 [Lachnospiraceae bacterium]|nr:30S ribosomal protein S6 [Lachnospiraceae bacterium]